VSLIDIHRQAGVATLALRHGKVNAINDELIRELRARLDDLLVDTGSHSLVLTGQGKFFSFGLDLREILPLSEEACLRFLTDFTALYTRMYNYPKPIVAAVNGHAVAGGCMLALACDRRIMASGNVKIGLNEITFGSSVFAGSAEMLQACVGERHAETILTSGDLYAPEQALALGLVDRVVAPEALSSACVDEAFASLKRLLRGPVVERMRRREADALREFVKIWYSEATRAQLAKIDIREEDHASEMKSIR
jgi:enoyl-CoA hydratase/carnithine racemase